MSEKLLKIIIQLLAIVAKEDDVSSSEVRSILQFLKENTGEKAAQIYLNYFHECVEEIEQKIKTGEFDDTKLITELAVSVNLEFTQRQKLVVMIDLMELIISDGNMSERELELIYIIGLQFNFQPRFTDYVKSFVVNTDRDKFLKESILIIDGNIEPIKSRHLLIKSFPGMLVFFNIPKINTYFVKYIGNAKLLLNGNQIRPHQILPFPVGSSVKCQEVNPIYYSDVASQFRRDGKNNRISFVAEDISYKFKNGNIGLQNINIAEPTGRLIAIMGGSGAGKSTLFDVLNGNQSPATGSIRINGLDINKKAEQVEGLIGFVPQDDLLMEDLTVFDNLYYAAKLCFDHLEKIKLINLVNTTLLALGLSETRHLKVGNTLQKTISGGQRKRLNIGLELLREPTVLFVDEPTSGLSSRDSENIMDLLKELSLKGKMIFVVIHQPSSDIYKMFDKLLLLDVGGYQIYYGDPVEAISYFKNIADLLDKDEGECRECGNVNPEQIFNIIESKLVDEFGQVTQVRKIKPDEWHLHFKENIKKEEILESNDRPHKSLNIPNRINQLRVFITRDVLSKLSNRQYLIINLLEAPILALLLAIVVRFSASNGEYTFRENVNIPAFFFMSIIVALFMGLTISAEEIIRDRKILKREEFLHLSRLSYLLSKTVILFIISAIQTILFVVIGELVLEIRGMSTTYFLVLFSISCYANMLGLNISSAFNSAVTIYILIPLLVIPQLILSGVVVNFDKLNPVLASEDKVPLVGELMVSRWAQEALAVEQFKENEFEKQFYELDRKIAQAEYKTIYYIPYLESALDYSHLHMNTKDKAIAQDITGRLNLVRNEIKKELTFVGSEKFKAIEQISFSQFNTELFDESLEFLNILKKYYTIKRNNATKEKDKMISDISNSPEQKADFLTLRDQYQNESIIKLLKNTTAEIRIIEQNGELVQKVYPIYSKNEFPKSAFDFRTNFYYPEKYFLGTYFGTPLFNIAIIWCFTLFLFVMLYFDILRKIVTAKY
jgi:ABC-type multidrug transport system ATPase subunit/uncharacterized tellurite resistance protein B-like protein